MPATNTKSPARVPTLQVPVGAIAPAGESVLTPFGDTGCFMAADYIRHRRRASGNESIALVQ